MREMSEMGEESQRGSESRSSDLSQLQDVMRIGELLIKEGFARDHEIERAFAIAPEFRKDIIQSNL